MSKIFLAPTGRVIQGHVLDSARGPLERRLREYDSQLYVRWNPLKLKGWGAWELRRRPENKIPVDSATYRGNTYIRLEYRENNFESHILDVPYLNYKLLEKVQEMDTWSKSYKAKDFAGDLEYREAKAQEAIEEKAQAERDYNIKQHKSQIRDLMDYVASGGNPALIADHWNKQGST